MIHRDLKPANVMVGAFGELQVMDWGLAKVIRTTAPGRGEAPPPQSLSLGGQDGPLPTLDFIPEDRPAAEHTHAGTILGTPGYMAPEQARGEIERLDPRTDVFALGAILCEILTGRPPVGGAEVAAVIARTAAGELTKGLKRLDQCKADGELIRLARACLAADPANRPLDAGVIAAAVLAYQTGLQERLRAAEVERAAAEAKMAETQAKVRAQRRTKWVAFGVLGAALWGTAGSIFFAYQAANYQTQSRDHRERVAGMANKLWGSLPDIPKLVQDWKRFGRLAPKDPLAAGPLPTYVGQAWDGGFLHWAASKDLPSEQAAHEGRVRAVMVLGYRAWSYGSREGAGKEFQKAVGLLEELAVRYPDLATECQINRRFVQGERGTVLLEQDRYEEAGAHLREALTDPGGATLSFTSAQQDKQFQDHHPWLLFQLGRVYQAQKRWAEAEAVFRQARADSAQRILNDTEGQLLGHLGEVLFAQGRRQEAAACFAQEARFLGSGGGPAGWLAQAQECDRLAVWTLRCGEEAKARELGYASEQHLASVASGTPSLPGYCCNPELQSGDAIAVVHGFGQGLEYEPVIRAALRLRLDQAERPSPLQAQWGFGLGKCYSCLGILQLGGGNPRAALESFRAAIGWMEKSHPQLRPPARVQGQLQDYDHWDGADQFRLAVLGHAEALSDLGQQGEALQALERLAKPPLTRGTRIPDLRPLSRALFLARSGDPAAARAEVERLGSTALIGPGPLFRLASVWALCVQAAKGDTRLADVYTQRAFEALRRTDPQFHREKARALLEQSLDLEALRLRPEFAAFLQELATSPKPGGRALERAPGPPARP